MRLAAAFEGFFELMEVVDVAVQAGVDDACFAGGTRGPVVDRVAVGLGDGPDRRPAGVGVDRVELGREGDDGVQQGIVRDGAAQEPDVVPQAADFSRHLVGERDGDGIGVTMGGDPLVQEGLQGQTAGEFLLQTALAERGAEVLVVGGAEREQERDPGGVPAPHLHAVDAVQDRVDVAEDVDGGGRVSGAGQEVAHLGDVAQDFGSQAPDGVLEMLDALGHEVGLGGGKPPDLLVEAADVAGQALGQRHRDTVDARLEGRIAEERAEDIRASALARPSPQIRDAVRAAQVGVGQASPVRAAGVEMVGPDALRQRRQGCDG